MDYWMSSPMSVNALTWAPQTVYVLIGNGPINGRVKTRIQIFQCQIQCYFYYTLSTSPLSSLISLVG